MKTKKNKNWYVFHHIDPCCSCGNEILIHLKNTLSDCINLEALKLFYGNHLLKFFRVQH